MGVAIFGAMLGPVIGGIASVTGTEATFGGVALPRPRARRWPRSRRRRADPSGAATGLAARSARCASSRMLASVWFVALPAISFGALGVLGPLRMHELGLGAVAIGAVWLVGAGFEATSAPMVGQISDRHGPLVPLAAAARRRSGLRAVPGPGRRVVALVPRRSSRAASRSAPSGRPAMSMTSDEAETLGLDYAFAFALINLAWAPGQVGGRRGRRRARGTDVRRRGLSRARGAVRPYACRAVEIHKLLVANRGEIALRIFRTCRELGIATVAVVAPDDRGSLHARRRTRRSRSRATSSRRSNPRSEASGADAIHPGYGFLAENADFAAAVRRRSWSGSARRRRHCAPAATSSRRSGSRARRAFPSSPTGEPDEVGFPLLVKAAAGGGGRGMRVVRARASSTTRSRPRAARQRPRSATTASSASVRRAAAPRRDPAPRRRARQGRRARRARMLDSAAPSEGARRVASPASTRRCAPRSATPPSRFARAIGYESAGTAEFMLDGATSTSSSSTAASRSSIR